MNSLQHWAGNAQLFEPIDIDFDVFSFSTYISVSEVIYAACVFMLALAYFGARGLSDGRGKVGLQP